MIRCFVHKSMGKCNFSSFSEISSAFFQLWLLVSQYLWHCKRKYDLKCCISYRSQSNVAVFIPVIENIWRDDNVTPIQGSVNHRFINKILPTIRWSVMQCMRCRLIYIRVVWMLQYVKWGLNSIAQRWCHMGQLLS